MVWTVRSIWAVSAPELNIDVSYPLKHRTDDLRTNIKKRIAVFVQDSLHSRSVKLLWKGGKEDYLRILRTWANQWRFTDAMDTVCGSRGSCSNATALGGFSGDFDNLLQLHPLPI